MIRILHIAATLGLGGSGRSLCAIAKHLRSFDDYQHTVISLLPRADQQRQLAERSGARVLEEPDNEVLRKEIEQADIVHVEWWNHPSVYDFLRTSWPPMRLLLFAHVAGDVSPNLITSQVVDFADFWVSGCGYAHRHAVIQQLPAEIRREKTAVVTATTDWDRLRNLRRNPHDTFNVGYVGSVDFKKMHPEYVSMSARVQAPSVRFVVCGDGHIDLLKKQAEQLGASARFEFLGYVEDIRPVLEITDVYGYPLCSNPGAELNLQEAMFAGIPPVVFPLGGIVDAVRHQENGMIVNDEKEYAQAIDYLYEHPLRLRAMGEAARQFALKHFGGERSSAKLHDVYQTLLRRPKREHVWPASPNPIASAPHRRGAEHFIESLGGGQTPYYISLYGDEAEAVLAAEEQIARQTSLERTLFEAYPRFYPQDVYLPYWLGLALQRQGQHEQAATEFSKVHLEGPTAWRLSWRRAQVAASLGKHQQAREFFRRVLEQAPDFALAEQLA